MKKLTNNQKIDIYEKMIEIIEEKSNGFCSAFLGVTRYNDKDMLKVLPELKKYKPHETIIKYYKSFWFNKYDYEIRLEILKDIIENLKKKIK